MMIRILRMRIARRWRTLIAMRFLSACTFRPRGSWARRGLTLIEFSNPMAAVNATTAANALSAPELLWQPPQPAPSSGLMVWEQAQRPYRERATAGGCAAGGVGAEICGIAGRHPRDFAVRELRSVAAPAIAVEVSSMSASDPNSLLAIGASLTATIERSDAGDASAGIDCRRACAGTAGAK